jgi:sulfate transport system permease protein
VTALPLARRREFRLGTGLGLGTAVLYLSLIVLIPLAAVVWRSTDGGWGGFWTAVNRPDSWSALKLTVLASAVVALVNMVMGTIIAWVLVRDSFPGKSIVDALIDLPFALPTAVAGISLTAIYAPNGWIGALVAPLGWKIAYTPVGILIALVFIGLPFIVRTLQPVLEDLDVEVEEAAATLGASRWRTVFWVVVPPLVPPLLTGFALALARAVGEYGSVIFIAGNIPFVSEIAPLLIVIKLTEYNYAGATAIATVMLAISFVLLLAINLLQAWTRRRLGHV